MGGLALRSGKNQRFETLVSSAGPGRLSNILPGIFNQCLKLSQHLLPQNCQLCGAKSANALCMPCTADLPWLRGGRCSVCAMPLASGAVCGACLDRPPRFERVDAVFAYRFPVDTLIHAYKYGGRLALARPLGEMLAERAARDVDAIVPMPLAHGRLAERGFNQALEIARVAAARTGVRLLPGACRKVADTPPQAALPWKERAKNVRRAFVCDAILDGMRVAVVDDVLTTGATLNELARVLRKAGAASVRGWIVARTLPN
jgi:ComF family protein